jgi:hypothetical protein
VDVGISADPLQQAVKLHCLQFGATEKSSRLEEDTMLFSHETSIRRTAPAHQSRTLSCG